MNHLLTVTKALNDASRIRALAALRGRELCLCQLIDLLELAPSTVSKHVDLLQQAGLVRRRKQGRWHFYRLAGAEAPASVTGALEWLFAALDDEPTIDDDAVRLDVVQSKDLQELAACYRS